jgi:hypothetical protein
MPDLGVVPFFVLRARLRAGSLQKQKRRVRERHASEPLWKPILEACEQAVRTSFKEPEMSTSLHSEKSLLLQTQVTVARAHALAVQKLPVALTLSAIILSIVNVRL